MNYLHTIAAQLDEIDPPDTANFLVVANDGEPSYVQIRDREEISTFRQNEERTKLCKIETIVV